VKTAMVLSRKHARSTESRCERVSWPTSMIRSCTVRYSEHEIHRFKQTAATKTGSIVRKQVFNARFGVIAAVLLNDELFWDVTPCPLVYSYRSLGGYWLRHSQIRTIPEEQKYTCFQVYASVQLR
jgi:hypothetical protein